MKLISPTGKSLEDIQREASWVHHQDILSATWVVAHPLAKYPSVTVVTSANEVVLASVVYDSLTQVTVAFSGSMTGKVYLN